MHPVIHKIGHHTKRHYHERYVKPHGVRAHLILTIDGILVAIILGLLALGSYFAFVYDPLRDTFGMRFEEAALASGGTAEIALTIENRGDTGLEDASVDVFFPPQFRVYSRSTESEHDIEIGAIPKGASLTYRFQGLLLGPEGEAPVYARMKATDGFGATDERFIEGRLTWSENRLKLAWDVPATVLSGQDIPLTLRARNASDFTMQDARLKLDFPEGFSVRLSTPPIATDGIPLGEFRPGDEITVDILGSFPKDTALSASRFGAELYLAEGDARTLAAETSSDVAVISADVTVAASFSEEASYAKPGDLVPVRISYRNDSPHTLTDVKLRLPLDIRVSDLKASTALEGGLAGSALAWESVTTPELASVAPGAGGVVEGTIAVLGAISKYSTDPALELKPEAVFSITDFDVTDARLFGEGESRKIAGRVETAGVARYYTNEGDQIGRGPLPPRVGAATRYWVVLKAENGASEARDARMTIQLPDYVTWTGKAAVTAGFEVQASEDGTLLVWNIGSIPAHAGVSSSAPNVSLELALTPTASQANTSPRLISGATLTATDSWTGLSLSSSQGPLTTELPTDPFIEGRTVVRP